MTNPFHPGTPGTIVSVSRPPPPTHTHPTLRYFCVRVRASPTTPPKLQDIPARLRQEAPYPRAPSVYRGPTSRAPHYNSPTKFECLEECGLGTQYYPDRRGSVLGHEVAKPGTGQRYGRSPAGEEFGLSRGCVTLGRSLSFSEPHLPHLRNRDGRIYHSEGSGRCREV